MHITRTEHVITVRALTRPLANPLKDGRRDGPDWVAKWPKGQRFVLQCYIETQEIDAGEAIIKHVMHCATIRPQGGYASLLRTLDECGKVVSNAEQAELHEAIIEASEAVSDFDALVTICAQDNIDPKELLRSMWNRGIVGPHTIEQARLDTLRRWDAEDAS